MSKSFSKRLRLIVLALFSCILCAGLVLGAACSGNKNKGGITLDRYEVIMYVGDVQDINASGEDKNGKEFSAFDYEWSISGDDCITIEPAGSGCRITALSNGSATVRVDAGNFSAKCDVVVLDVAVEKVTLDKETLELNLSAGAEDIITATAELNNKKTYDGEYSWEIAEGGDYIEITPAGASCTVTAKSAGTAVITVTAGGKSATCTVTITGEYEQTHTHAYEVTGTVWSSDYTSCDITLTCANTDGGCEELTVTERTTDITTEAVTSPDCENGGSTTYVATLLYGGIEFTTKTTVATPALGHSYPAPGDENIDILVVWGWDDRNTESKTVEVTVECTVCHEKETFTANYTESADGKTLSATVNVGSYDYSSTYDVETGSSEQSGHTHGYTAAWEWNEADYTCKVTLTCSNEDGNCSEPTVTLDATVTPITVDSTCIVAGSVTYTASVEYSGTTYTSEGNDVKVVELPLAAHTLTAVEKVDATCTEDGAEAYWKCSVCEKLFSDGEGGTEIEAATVIPATGHTYPDTTETSNIQWNWESKVGNETSGTVGVTLICTECGEEIGTFEATYSVKSDDNTLWCAEYTVDNKTYTSTYPVSGGSSGETSEAVAELDFTGSDFAEGEILAGDANTDTKLTYANGTETGFTVKGSESNNKSVEISSNELGSGSGVYRQALVFNGTATSTKNSVAYTLNAGTYRVVVSYFNSNSGRYATVLGSDGKEKVSLIAEEDKTSGGSYDLYTREMYFTLGTEETIYIGSQNNGLYVTYIGIFEVDSIPEYTVAGVSLSDSEITLEVGKENEISAIVVLSDGKTYNGYDGEFTWSLEGAGVVSLPDTTKFSASFTGVAEGNETITVSINGCTASCVITVVAAEEVTLVPVVEVDFTAPGNFTSGTEILAANSGTTADIKYADGTSTGLTAVGTDSSNTKIEIATQNGTVVLKTNGTGSTTKGSVSYTFAEDGTYSVMISYMQNNSTARWGVVLDASGNELGDSVRESEKTDTSYTIKTRTVTFDAEAGDVIYIGSNNGGLYFTFIGIYKVEESSGDTGSGSGDSGSGDTGSGDTGDKNYEWVTAEFDIDAAIDKVGSGSDNKVPSGGYSQGIFTVASGAYFNSDNINTQGKDITIVLSGIENTLSFKAEGASGSNTLYVTLIKDGTDVTPSEWISVGLTNGVSAEFSAAGLEAGTYTLVTSCSAKIYNLKVEQYLEESNPESITVTAGTVDFLLGRNISVGDLNLNIMLNYENGRQDPLAESDTTTDLGSLSLHAGANTVTVTYTYTDESSQAHEFTATVTIYLYELESIEISDFSMAYTGGTYYTNNVQKIYLVGDTVSYAYAAVTAIAGYGTGSEKATATFILTADEVGFKTTDYSGNEITGPFTAAGAYTVTATVNVNLANDVSSSYTVNVVTAEGANATQVKVDQNAAAVSMDSEGVYTVTTINDAIQLIKLLGAPDNVRKYIYVGAGQYWEKIYIDIPNLTLVGANSSETDALATRQDSATGGTEIVYWAFNGLMDPSGTTTFSTVGSATVTVAKEAVGFCAANITFRNYWNTNALYLECKAMYNDTQADAAYINADKSYFYNVTFTGYHDTLEAENGRQYYDHCYIEGRTDYIFGNTATCYFYCCNIHTIGAGDSNNGGYVMAIKGTGVNYGYIFNYCNFTTDLETYYKDSSGNVTVPYEGFAYTVEGTVSVARTWSGSDMHIAILNSSFDAGFSKEAYIASTGKGESGKNSRYTHMTAGQVPTPEYLVEYGNSGDGAISASIDGTCTVYTIEADIADYLDFTKIFAAQNGSVKYDDDWSGASVELVTVTITANGTTYNVTGYKNSFTISDVIAAVKSEDATVEITELYDENGNALDETLKIDADMTLTAKTAEPDMTVPSSVIYDFSGADTSIPQSVNTGWLGYLYVDTGTSGEFKQNNDWYILTNDATITIRLSSGSSITFEMYENPSLAVNDVTISSSEMEESDGRYYYTYTVTSGETEEVVISRSTSGNLYFKTITITVPVIYQIGDYVDFTDATGITYQGSVDEYKGVQIDTTASGAKFAYDNAGCIQINTGTILCIPSVPGASAEVNFWGSYSGNYTVSTDEDGIITVTFTELSDNKTYIIGITITEDSDYEQPGGGTEEPEGIYDGTVTFDPESITVEVGNEASFVFSVSVTLDGVDYSGSDIDITVQSDNTGVAVESWNGETNSVTVRGVSAGTTYISIIVKVGDIEVINAKYTVVVTDASSPEEPSEPGEKTTVSGVSVDFSNSETFSWIETEQTSYTDSNNKTTEYNNAVKGISTTDDGILSVAGTSDNSASTPMDIGDKSSSAMTTGGKTQSGGRYFKIDLTSYEGMYVSVTIVTSGTGSESQSSKYLILGTNVSSTSVDEYTLANVTTSTSDVRQTLEYTDLITSTNSTLYVTWSDSVRIYTIDIEIYEYVSSSEPSEHSHNYEVSSWNWSDGYDECSVTLVCTVDGCTEREITVIATVTSESTKTATCSEDGEITYTATASANDQTFTESKNVSTGKDSSNHVYPEQYDTEHVVWHWDEITENSDEVSVTIYCTACGNEIATLTTTYTVYEGNSSYWYAEVSGDKYTYTSTCKIPGTDFVYSEVSFLVPIAENEAAALSGTFDAGDVITDNILFRITAGVGMSYGYGSSIGQVQSANNEFSYTDMNGNVVNPNQGIRMDGDGIDEAVEAADGGYTYSSEVDIISFTAKENIHIYVYVSFANNSYNSNRSGVIYYTVGGGERITAAEPTKRSEAFTISVELNSGETLVIGAENHSIRSSSSSSAATAKLWLWGAEAYTLEGEKPDYTAEKTVTFVTNQISISDFTRSVFNYSAVSAPILPNVSGCYFVGWYSDSEYKVAYDFSESVTEDITLYAKWVQFDSEITYIQGAYESIAIEFYETNPDGLRIYYKEGGASSYTQFTDSGAIRTIDAETYLVRVDISGLTGDRYYSVKILTSANEELTDDGAAYSIYVASYDRSGYAHFNYDDGVGAYEDDGTLKDGALVIYVTEENKNDVTNDMYVYSDGTYNKVTASDSTINNCLTLPSNDSNYQSYVEQNIHKSNLMCGIGEILNNRRYSNRNATGIAALCNAYNGVVIRIVGEVTASAVITRKYEGEDGETHEMTTLYEGYYDIVGLTNLNSEDNGGSTGDNGGLVRIYDAHDITIEGVGEGAVVNGWGFHFVAATANLDEDVKTGKSFEVRNLTFINYPEDAIGMEGTQTTAQDGEGNKVKSESYLTASVERCWIHNNTFYAGYCATPAESDKGEGDGSCDFKRGQYFTLSYNYFEDCHKTNLFGADGYNLQYNITMHHNFWYNCQSRMPMVRSANVHFYNNYVLWDENGTSLSYVMSARADAYIYSEFNYFEGCKDVFKVELDAGSYGVIKSYGDVLYNSTTGEDSVNYVSSRGEKVENTCKYTYADIDYTSFDTSANLFYYDTTKGRSDCYITSAEQAKTEVMQTAGAFSRDKVVSCEQCVKASDITSPTPQYDFDTDETSLTYSGVVLVPCRKESF